ncbi:hypothetical protein U9M48_030127, partial [Paspalum notatum var. saurae]
MGRLTVQPWPLYHLRSPDFGSPGPSVRSKQGAAVVRHRSLSLPLNRTRPHTELRCKAGEPVRGVRGKLNLDERPLHGLRCAELFTAITNHAEADVWIVKALLDPLEALQLPHLQRA